MPSLRARPIVEGALLAALAALLGLASFYTGFGWPLAIPVLLAARRHGARSAALVTVVASGLLVLWLGPLAGLAAFGFLVANGLTGGWALRRGWGAAACVGLMALAFLAVTAAGMGAADLLWHSNFWGQAWRSFANEVTTHAALFAPAGVTPQQLLSAVRTLLPVAAIVMAVGQAAGVYLLAAGVMGRLGEGLPAVPPFAQWRLPPWATWAALAALGLALLAHERGDKVLASTSGNLLLAAACGYSVIAVALGYGWLRGRGLSRRRASVLLACAVGVVGLTQWLVLPLAGFLASQFQLRPGPAPGGRGEVP